MSKRIKEAFFPQSKLIGAIPYVDPKKFNRQKNNYNQVQAYFLNEKSDIYSVGVLLWEISSGHPPFNNEPHDINLIIEISQGLRESPTSDDIPKDYIKIYSGKYTQSYVLWF